MLRLRPFRTPDVKTIVNWTSAPEEFYKWSAGIMGEYPVSEKRLLEAVSGREDNPRYFPLVAFDESGLVGFLLSGHRARMIKKCALDMSLSILRKGDTVTESKC